MANIIMVIPAIDLECAPVLTAGCTLQGNLWKESLDILKLAVSHSSNLNTPPPRPASTVLDGWITDPLKKELPGRTLDFTFELSATRVVSGFPTTTETPGEPGKESKASVAEMSGWRKPGLSQVRPDDLIDGRQPDATISALQSMRMRWCVWQEVTGVRRGCFLVVPWDSI